jgi:hypothetical protein
MNFDSIFKGTADTTAILPINVTDTLFSILISLLLGFLISIVYLISIPKRERSRSFILSLMILPCIVAVIIILIGGNIARAFSMAGVFTLVRFRSLPGDSKDISFVFLTMAVGLAVGTGYLTFGAAITVILGVMIIMIRLFGFRFLSKDGKRLRIVVPEDINYQDTFDDLFAKYTKHYEIIKVKTTNLGTLYELTYEVIMNGNIMEKEFIDELRCRNGNLEIQLGINENTTQHL